MSFETSPNSPGKATAWALAIAAVLLVTVVLPAEYGIDWTGAGRVLGLKAMGDQKVAAAKASPAPSASPALAAPGGVPKSHATRSDATLRQDSIDIALPAQGEIEYKTVLAEGGLIVFQWDAGGTELQFDFHGEPAAGPEGAFLSFHKGAGSRSAGSLQAPFAGTHGWYWKNSSSKAVVIKLRVAGFHTELKRN